MIHVIATIEVKPEAFAEYLDIFRANIPTVFAEDGCIRYELTVDDPDGAQLNITPRDGVATVVEAWESIEALTAHLQAPHMKQYKQDTKDLVICTKVNILKPA
ncbi:MAG: antibiotic biosynthesis monooxygenase [Phycisphaerae bacterium]|nr:antibiotic biosynthesis monooxygenase [Phycisphaerae bacterium]